MANLPRHGPFRTLDPKNPVVEVYLQDSQNPQGIRLVASPMVKHEISGGKSLIIIARDCAARGRRTAAVYGAVIGEQGIHIDRDALDLQQQGLRIVVGLAGLRGVVAKEIAKDVPNFVNESYAECEHLRFPGGLYKGSFGSEDTLRYAILEHIALPRGGYPVLSISADNLLRRERRR